MLKSVMTYLAVIVGIVAFSGLFVLIFGNSIEVHCLRESGGQANCRITRKLLGQVPVSTKDLLGVTDIQVDETCDDGCSYRAVLLTSTGESVPFNEVYTDRAIVNRQMDALAPFLDGAQTSLDYVEPVPWWVVGMILAMDLIGLVIVAASFLRSARAGRS